jgi:hypothetical protein
MRVRNIIIAGLTAILAASSFATTAAATTDMKATVGNSTATSAAQIPMAPTSVTSGSFTWEADFKCCLNSREWTQNAGGTTISGYGDCSGDPGLQYYSIELIKDQFVDKSYGLINYPCFSSRSRTWNGLPAGTYYFRISKRDNGNTISAWGSVGYP